MTRQWSKSSVKTGASLENKEKAELGVDCFQRLTYLSEIGVTGNRVRNTLQLMGYARFPAQELFLHNFLFQHLGDTDYNVARRATDRLNTKLKYLHGLVFEHAQGGQLLETVKKRFENRDSIKGFDSGHPVEALAVENWHTILRFMFEIGTALQNLSGAHRAVTLSNVFLRHRLYPPDVSEKVVKTKPFLDRYQAVFGNPCLPEEVDDTTFWKSMDYPRPLATLTATRGKDAMKFGYFACQLIEAALPGLEDIKQYPAITTGHDDHFSSRVAYS